MPDLKHEHTIIIDASPDEIYDYVSSFRRHTEWNEQPQEIRKVTEGPVGVGARFHTTEKLPAGLSWFMKNVMMPIFTRVLGSKDYTVAEITAMEPGRRFAWTAWQPIRGGKRAIEVRWEIELQPQNGATRLTQRSHWIPRHKMSDPTMLEDNIAGGVKENLDRLKKLLEKQEGGGNGTPVGAIEHH